VEEGDFLVGVNGEPLDASTDPYRLLDGTAGRQTVLHVNDQPGDHSRAALSGQGRSDNLQYRLQSVDGSSLEGPRRIYQGLEQGMASAPVVRRGALVRPFVVGESSTPIAARG